GEADPSQSRGAPVSRLPAGLRRGRGAVAAHGVPDAEQRRDVLPLSARQQQHHRKEIAEQKLQALDLAGLDAQTRFVNAKLAERAFSWSTLLDELESV